jgi:imidazolonepropionase-like amidohydrolase
MNFSPPSFILENARIFDGVGGDCPDGMSVAIENGLIREVSEQRIALAHASRIDVGGRTLMPGMIDLHIHAYVSDINLQRVDQVGHAHRTAHAVRLLGHALDCGFTTVRDVGGGDWSLWRALEDGLIRGPRFFYAGKILSMTGGHGDFRPIHMERDGQGGCGCGGSNSLSIVANGVHECIAAAREELRRGAHTIKIMGSGGIVSPTDPIWMNQFREDEIRAIVNECVERRSYASAHCHPPSAIRRCVEYGVRCIEHGTLIDDDTAAFVARSGAYIVPTMSVLFALSEEGRQHNLPTMILGKIDEVIGSALEGMERMRRAQVKLGFGTDLVGHTYVRQCGEFLLRREVFSPLEILRQATSTGAEVLQLQGRLGCVSAGANADLLVVDGDPLRDVGLLAQHGGKLPLIMLAGQIVKNRLS